MDFSQAPEWQAFPWLGSHVIFLMYLLLMTPGPKRVSLKDTHKHDLLPTETSYRWARQELCPLRRITQKIKFNLNSNQNIVTEIENRTTIKSYHRKILFFDQ